jgi:hypothetical protein
LPLDFSWHRNGGSSLTVSTRNRETTAVGR